MIRRLLAWLTRPCTCPGCHTGDPCHYTAW